MDAYTITMTLEINATAERHAYDLAHELLFALSNETMSTGDLAELRDARGRVIAELAFLAIPDAPARAEIVGNCLVCDAVVFDDGSPGGYLACPNGCVNVYRD